MAESCIPCWQGNHAWRKSPTTDQRICNCCGVIEKRSSESNRQAGENSGSGATGTALPPSAIASIYARTLNPVWTNITTTNSTNTLTFQTGASTGVEEASEEHLPIEQSNEGFIGWKQAHVERGRAQFRGMTVPTWYGVDEWAKCEVSPCSCTVVPRLNCTCGFYAYKSVDHSAFIYLEYDTSSAILQVELYGKVIVHELGYRAQRQRILRAWVPDSFYPGCDLSSWYGTEVRSLSEWRRGKKRERNSDWCTGCHGCSECKPL